MIPGPNTLFQVPVARVDVWNASIIQKQKPVNPGNCGAASGLMLGLLTPAMSEYYSALDLQSPTVWVSNWEQYLANDGNAYNFRITTVAGLKELSDNLFPGCGTLVLFSCPRQTFGHWVVIVKYTDGTISLLDLQNGILVGTLDEAKAYLSRTFRIENNDSQLNTLRMGFFTRNVLANLPDVLYFFYLFRSRALITNTEVNVLMTNTEVNAMPSLDKMIIGGRRRSHKLRKTRKIRITP